MILLPDIGGGVFYARKMLPHLAPRRGVYGMGLDPALLEDLSGCTLEGLARRFAADLHTAALAQPLHLVGHCFAGFLAFETARHMAELDTQVGVVALLDSTLPSRFYPRRYYRMMAAAHEFKNRQRDWLANTLFRRPNGDPSMVLHVPGYIRVDLSSYPESYRYIVRHLYQAMLDYEPGPYAGDLTLFRALDRRGLAAVPRDLGWEPYARGDVEVIQLAGDHFDMVLDDRAAAEVAECLDRILDTTERQTSRMQSATEIGGILA